MQQVALSPDRGRLGAAPGELQQLIAAPAVLCCAMIAIALVTTSLAHVRFTSLFAPYLGASLAITFMSVLLSLFCWTAVLARRQSDEPVRVVARRLKGRLSLLVLPAIIFPLFLIAFTATKSAIPFLVGYGWDRFWSDADRMLFGADAWRIARQLLAPVPTIVWEWFYTFAWGLTLIFASALVTLNARPSRVAVFYTAMMSSWLIGGVAIAYATSAAGPAFAHLFDPALASRFAPLRQFLASDLPPSSSVLTTQAYLASAITSHDAVKGGGISAMPSMHIAAATIYVLAARRSWWIVPAVLFWAVIFVCSAYFGYHYWVDGLVAAVVAVASWWAAERVIRDSSAQPRTAGLSLLN